MSITVKLTDHIQFHCRIHDWAGIIKFDGIHYDFQAVVKVKAKAMVKTVF